VGVANLVPPVASGMCTAVSVAVSITVL
jgi:hypothetical protein